jgi:Putative beta-barrel porin-2, OmpL-like. bbp2
MTTRFIKLTALTASLMAALPCLRAQTAPMPAPAPAAAPATPPPPPAVTASVPVTFSGWATGSTTYTTLKPGGSTSSTNVDSALLGVAITASKEVTANVSVFFHPGAEGGVSPSGNQVTILDAYVTYDAGGGLTIKAGKYLSPLGYESFFSINDNMITAANQALLAPIPGYHEGVEFDYAPDKTTTMGLGLVDSLYQKPGYAATEGDGEFKHNVGVEGYVQYTGVTDLTLWAGFGYATSSKPGLLTDGVVKPKGSEVTVLDVWASYAITKSSTLVLEEIYKDGGTGNKGSNWLGYFQYNCTDKFSSWFCVSGEAVSDGGPKYTKYSISPTYAVTANLSVRAQYSYTKFTSFGINSANFVGAEVLFKF